MPKVNRRRIETVIAALVAVGAGAVGIANHEAARGLGPKFVSVERLARLKNPVFLTQPPGPGSQLFVAQAGGTIRVISDDRLLRRPFLNISDRVDARGVRGEPGIASIAFPPDYQRSRQFYVAYSRRNALIVARYRRSATDPLLADPGSGQTILQIHEPTAAHHGGLLAFGLTATSTSPPAMAGQGEIRSAPRRTSSCFAGRSCASTRPRPDAGIPVGNPFVGKPGRDEIWSYGLRNPRGLSFDRTKLTTSRSPTRARTASRRSTTCPSPVRVERISAGRRSRPMPPLRAGWPATTPCSPRSPTAIGREPDRRGLSPVRDPRLARIRGGRSSGTTSSGTTAPGSSTASVRERGRAGEPASSGASGSAPAT